LFSFSIIIIVVIVALLFLVNCIIAFVVVVIDDWRFRACAAVTASIALSTLPLALRNASLASSRESHGHAANKAVRGRIEYYNPQPQSP
jgi:hypothetical protein